MEYDAYIIPLKYLLQNNNVKKFKIKFGTLTNEN